MEKNKTDPHRTPHIKMNPGWIKDQTVQGMIMKLTEITQEISFNQGAGKDFLNKNSKAKAIRPPMRWL